MGYNKWSGGESTQKAYDKKKFDANFDRIFGKKSQDSKEVKKDERPVDTKR